MAAPVSTLIKAKQNPKKLIIIIIALIVVLWFFLSTIRVIGTGEIGVVTRYGKVIGRELGEGIHMVAPFGVDKVTIYDIKVLKQQDEVTAASKDLQDVGATLALNYRINSSRVSEVHQKIGEFYPFKLIDPALQEVFKATSAKYSAQELITNRAEVKSEALKLIKERLEGFGIVVDDLSIVNFKFSEAYSKAIEEKQIAQQNAERARFNLEAAKIDAEAQSAQAQTLSPLFLQKQAIDKWDGKLPTYLGQGQGTVFNIPLQ